MSYNIQVLNYWMNEYNSSGRQGTDPRPFVQSYMPRPDATEVLLLNNAHEKVNQLVQQKANLMESPQQISKQVGKKYGLNWRGFTRDSDSCLGSTVHRMGDKMLQLYNQGHTIRKIMVSFRTPYLKRMRTMDKGFQMNHNGSAFGEIDQLKMRDAMRIALAETSEHFHYINPAFFGALQLDRSHAHFHIILADDCPVKDSHRLIKASEQHSDYTGRHLEEKGKMPLKERQALKRNFQDQLGLIQEYPVMHYQPSLYQHSHGYEVRIIASKDLGSNVYLQELIASLPKNKREWFYGNRAPVMQRPGRLMSQYIQSLTVNHGKQIGYDHAQNTIYAQALNHATYKHPFKELYNNGHTRLSMVLTNLVYKQLKHAYSSKEATVQTPYLRIESADSQDLGRQVLRMYKHEPVHYPYLTMRMYRKRSYQERYLYHHKMRNHYRDILHKMDVQNLDGAVDPVAIKSVRRYYAINKQYHTDCMDKYRYILGFQPSDTHYMQNLMSQRSHLMGQYSLVHRMNHRTIVNSQGHIQILLPQSLQRSYNKYALAVSTFSDHAYDVGMIDSSHVIDTQYGYSHPFIVPPKLHRSHIITSKDFNKVKGLDIDDCSLDFSPSNNRVISDDTVSEYDQSTKERYEAAKLAKRYILRHLRNQPLRIQRNVDRLLHLVELEKKRKRAKKLKQTHRLQIIIPARQRKINENDRNEVTVNVNTTRHYLSTHLHTLNEADDKYATAISRHPRILRARPQVEDDIEF